MTSMAPLQAVSVTDVYGRTLRYLRLSVTDRCNLRCQYCNPNGTCPTLAPEPLSWDDLFWMIRVAAEDLGVQALRITGGEPTVRPGLAHWIAAVRARIPSVRDIAMTTNGVLLATMAGALADAGLARVNISMDSLRPDRFRAITRGGDLARVLAGFDAARRHFRQVKVNVVALRGQNLDELNDFVAFSDREEVEVRFIEPMPLGNEKDYWREVFVPADELRARLEAAGHRLVPASGRSGFGPAATYFVAGTRARIGFISQMSCAKCATCNKLRLTSDGVLRPCLLSAEEVPLQRAVAMRDADNFASALRQAFLQRPKEYSFADAASKDLGRSMQCIGG